MDAGRKHPQTQASRRLLRLPLPYGPAPRSLSPAGAEDSGPSQADSVEPGQVGCEGDLYLYSSSGYDLGPRPR